MVNNYVSHITTTPDTISISESFSLWAQQDQSPAQLTDTVKFYSNDYNGTTHTIVTTMTIIGSASAPLVVADSVSVDGSDQLTSYFTVTPNGASTSLKTIYQYKGVDASKDSITHSSSPISGGLGATQYSQAITDLQSDTTYLVISKVQNSEGIALDSAEAKTDTLENPPDIAIPVIAVSADTLSINIALTSTDTTEVYFKSNDVSGKGAGAYNYWNWTLLATIAPAGDGDTLISHTGLNNATKYWYRARNRRTADSLSNYTSIKSKTPKSSGRNWYISAAGSSSNPGTFASPLDMNTWLSNDPSVPAPIWADSISPGDSILWREGDVWNPTNAWIITTDFSGNDSLYIVISSYNGTTANSGDNCSGTLPYLTSYNSSLRTMNGDGNNYIVIDRLHFNAIRINGETTPGGPNHFVIRNCVLDGVVNGQWEQCYINIQGLELWTAVRWVTVMSYPVHHIQIFNNVISESNNGAGGGTEDAINLNGTVGNLWIAYNTLHNVLNADGMDVGGGR